MNIQIIKYIIMGILTTIINIISFYFFDKIFSYQIANTIAFILSIIFAYITNKIYVFQSENYKLRELIREVSMFFLSRGLVYILDILLMIFLIEILNTNKLFSKITTNIVVVVINYIISKYIIFKEA